jgi:hypothetical protein
VLLLNVFKLRVSLSLHASFRQQHYFIIATHSH